MHRPLHPAQCVRPSATFLHPLHATADHRLQPCCCCTSTSTLRRAPSALRSSAMPAPQWQNTWTPHQTAATEQNLLEVQELLRQGASFDAREQVRALLTMYVIRATRSAICTQCHARDQIDDQDPKNGIRRATQAPSSRCHLRAKVGALLPRSR